MKKLILAAAALAVLPQVAAAQNLPAPIIAVVDSNKAANDCTACRTASSQLQQQRQSAQQFQQSLLQPLQTEQQAIEAAAALAVLPQVAAAQNLPAPIIAVVDSNKAANDCTACRTASSQLQQQRQSAQQFQQSLLQPLQTEQQAIEAAAKALGGKEPDAALKQRAQSFEQRYQSAQQQLSQRGQTLERNRQHVLRQINDKLQPAIAAVQARRRATIVLDAGAVVKFSPTVDITSEVVAELNRSLTSISTTAPAQAQQNPQGR